MDKRLIRLMESERTTALVAKPTGSRESRAMLGNAGVPRASREAWEYQLAVH